MQEQQHVKYSVFSSDYTWTDITKQLFGDLNEQHSHAYMLSTVNISRVL